ncbi:hypothetical protein CHARACLAT_029658 [Characodon lateralis]|uniref:Uncharacterized protein n=1 Tax=Characodon lateralis TaxID=208331 RepID=A0ABU7DDR7_9TELE|nr:hypothetical protein [Characodon lateralis]
MTTSDQRAGLLPLVTTPRHLSKAADVCLNSINSGYEKEKLKCLERKVALTLARYLEKEERFLTPPSIRVVVTIKQKDDDIQKAVSCIREAASVLLK